MAETWLINPKGVKNMATRRRKRRVAAPKRRRRTTAAAPKRRVYRRNPPKRRRKYNRNPATLGIMQNSLYAIGGFMGSKLVGNTIQPYVSGIMGGAGDVGRIAIKGATAYGTAYVLSHFVLGKKTFTPLFLGALADVIQDVTDTFIAPTVPFLQGGSPVRRNLSSYYQGPRPANMGSYYRGAGARVHGRVV